MIEQLILQILIRKLNIIYDKCSISTGLLMEYFLGSKWVNESNKNYEKLPEI